MGNFALNTEILRDLGSTLSVSQTFLSNTQEAHIKGCSYTLLQSESSSSGSVAAVKSTVLDFCSSLLFFHVCGF